MTAPRNGIQSALPIKNRQAYIRNIHYSATAVWKHNTVLLYFWLWKVASARSWIHSFTLSLTIQYLSPLQTSVTRLLFALVLNCLCPRYLMTNCEFQSLCCVSVHSGANEIIGCTTGPFFKMRPNRHVLIRNTTVLSLSIILISPHCPVLYLKRGGGEAESRKGSGSIISPLIRIKWADGVI